MHVKQIYHWLSAVTCFLTLHGKEKPGFSNQGQ